MQAGSHRCGHMSDAKSVGVAQAVAKRMRAPIPHTLPDTADQQAIYYTFGNILTLDTGALHLQSLLLDNDVPDLLKEAAIAVACSFISLDPRHTHFKNLAISKYVQVMRTLQSLIQTSSVLHDHHVLVIMHLFMIWEVV